MIKIWGRNTSSNVQKAMWAVGELGLEHTRIDVGGAFGKNKEPPYLAMNPNALVPTLEEEDGFLLWESNSIVRYLAGKHDKAARSSRRMPSSARWPANGWIGSSRCVGPAITPVFWGLIRTPPEKRDMAAIKASQERRPPRCRSSTRNSPRRRSSPAMRSPTATSRSAACAIASVHLCRIGRRCRTSTAGTRRFRRARPSTMRFGRHPPDLSSRKFDVSVDAKRPASGGALRVWARCAIDSGAAARPIAHVTGQQIVVDNQ